MSHNILITGGSGYLGGDLLFYLKTAELPAYNKLFALVRTTEQAQKVKTYYDTVEPLEFDAYVESAVYDSIVDNEISVVFHLIDPLNSTSQVNFIKALAEVKKRTGRDVHFLHTTGAKIFSSHVGAPTDRPLLDTEPDLYDIQKAQRGPVALAMNAVHTNNTVIEESQALGVHAYIFAPCIVYGKSRGFGNPISIQTVAIVKAAKAARRVYRTDEGRPSWPVCHVEDNTTMYFSLLRAILSGSDVDHGKNGYYLASPGSVAWDDIYDAMAAALLKRGIIDNAKVGLADQASLERMAQGLGYPPEFVAFQLGGKCMFTAKHAKEKLGWNPAYKPEHILEYAEKEVDLILANLD